MPSGHVNALPINSLNVRIGSSLISSTINPPIKNATITATTGEINSRKKFFIKFYSKRQTTIGFLPFPLTLFPLTVFILSSASCHQQSDSLHARRLRINLTGDLAVMDYQ